MNNVMAMAMALQPSFTCQEAFFRYVSRPRAMSRFRRAIDRCQVPGLCSPPWEGHAGARPRPAAVLQAASLGYPAGSRRRSAIAAFRSTHIMPWREYRALVCTASSRAINIESPVLCHAR